MRLMPAAVRRVCFTRATALAWSRFETCSPAPGVGVEANATAAGAVFRFLLVGAFLVTTGNSLATDSAAEDGAPFLVAVFAGASVASFRRFCRSALRTSAR